MTHDSWHQNLFENFREGNFGVSRFVSASIFRSPLPAVDQLIPWGFDGPRVKRDPEILGEKTAATGTRSAATSSRKTTQRQREGKGERQREREMNGGKERKGSVERNRMERPVYLDDSPACFARRPYETG